MHRIGPVLLVTIALLTGCSPGSSTPATVTVSSPAPATATSPSESSDPIASDIFASQFHPCEVFTEEQFAEAGLGKHLELADRSDEMIRSCGFTAMNKDKYKGTFLVATDQADKERIQELDLEYEAWENKAVEGLYVHKMPSESRRCAAAFDFEWGRFTVDYMESGSEWESETLCEAPAAILESLIIQAGGIHGTQN